MQLVLLRCAVNKTLISAVYLLFHVLPPTTPDNVQSWYVKHYTEFLPTLWMNISSPLSAVVTLCFWCSGVCCTFSDDWDDVSSTQTGLADPWPCNISPVNHLLHTIIGHIDHHPVLRENTGRDRQFYSSGDILKELFVWSDRESATPVTPWRQLWQRALCSAAVH